MNPDERRALPCFVEDTPHWHLEGNASRASAWEPHTSCSLANLPTSGEPNDGTRYNVKARVVTSIGASAWTYIVARVGNAPQMSAITPEFASATNDTITFRWSEPPDDTSRAFSYAGELERRNYSGGAVGPSIGGVNSSAYAYWEAANASIQ